MVADRDHWFLRAIASLVFCCRHRRFPGVISAESSSRLRPCFACCGPTDCVTCHAINAICICGRSRWRRASRIATFGADLSEVSRRRLATACLPCAASGRHHLSAAGCTRQGVPWGAVAVRLPVELIRALVSAYCDGSVSIQSHVLMRCMTAPSQATE